MCRIFVLGCVAAVLAHPVRAEMCESVAHSLDLAAHARESGNLAWPNAWTVFAAATLNTAPRQTAFTGCTAAGESVACLWRFDVTDPDSATLYAEADTLFGQCLGAYADRFVDMGVNHPDIYDALRYSHPDIEIALSRKRKSADNEMRVTLRIQDRRAE